MSIQIQIYLSVIIDHDTFFCRVNGGRIIPGKEVVTLGNYKMFLDDTPIFDAKSYDHDIQPGFRLLTPQAALRFNNRRTQFGKIRWD